MSGYFLAIEGIDGSGKTTQCNLLAGWLQKLDIMVFQPQDPGTTNLGNELRQILLHRTDINIHPRAQTALFAAARCQLALEQIRPYLQHGWMVLVDRWTDSTVAYQSFAGGKSKTQVKGPGEGYTEEHVVSLDPDEIVRLCSGLNEGVDPNHTIILNISYEEAKKRLSDKQADRFESQEESFHQNLIRGYQWSGATPNHTVLDVNKLSKDEVFTNVRREFKILIEGGPLESQVLGNPRDPYMEDDA